MYKIITLYYKRTGCAVGKSSRMTNIEIIATRKSIWYSFLVAFSDCLWSNFCQVFLEWNASVRQHTFEKEHGFHRSIGKIPTFGRNMDTNFESDNANTYMLTLKQTKNWDWFVTNNSLKDEWISVSTL